VVLVTGAAGGIGSVTATMFAREGAQLVLTDLPGTSLDALAETIRARGSETVSYEGDITDEGVVEELVRTAVRTFGRLDVIDNVAGATNFIGRDTVVAELDVDVWDRVVAINARSVMLTAKHGIPAMLANGGGAIVNTSSGLSALGDDHSTAYGASKNAVNALTMYIATQYGKQGIRANCIAPGLILTPMAKQSPSPALEAILAHTMSPRLGDPEDIANAALFLASHRAAFINGQVLAVDGGHRAHQPHVPTIRDLFAEGTIDQKI
jgi:NAD(P)-dependent dehydrogenase (short-subunit alcohol dehydrogenase family)